MPRKNNRDRPSDEPLFTYSAVTTPVPAPAGWKASQYKGSDNTKSYICPACGVSFRGSVPHVVAKSDDAERQRHWHSSCWKVAVSQGIDRYRWD